MKGEKRGTSIGVWLFCFSCNSCFLKERGRYVEAEKMKAKGFYCSRKCSYEGVKIRRRTAPESLGKKVLE